MYHFRVAKTIVFNENTDNELRITMTCGAPTRVDCVEIISAELKDYEEGNGEIECLNNYREQYKGDDSERNLAWYCNYDDKDEIYYEGIAYLADADNHILVEWKIEENHDDKGWKYKSL